MDEDDVENGRDLVAEGVRLERYGRTAEAEELFIEAAGLGDPRGMYNCGLLAERRGDFEPARGYYLGAHVAGHPEAANNLGVLLFNAGDPEALDWFRIAEAMGHPQAAGNLRNALAAATTGSRRPKRRKAKALALHRDAEAAYRVFSLTGNDAALVRAVTLARQAVEVAAERDPRRAQMLAALRDLLRERYDRYGRSADIQEAVGTAVAAFMAVSSTDPQRPLAAQSLIAVLNRQFALAPDPDPLQWAVENIGRPVLNQPGGDPMARMALASSLSGALTKLAERADAGTGLDDAVAFGREAVALAPPGDALAFGNLGAALLLRGTRRGSLDDLNEAIEVLSAARTGEDPRHRVNAATNLVSALSARASLTGREADRQAAREQAQRVRQEPGAAPERHLDTLIGSAFAAQGPEAVEVVRRALDAAPAGHAARAMLLTRLATLVDAAGDRTAAVAAAREAAATAQDALSRLDAHRTLGRLLLNLDGEEPGETEKAAAHAAASEAVDAFTTAAEAGGPGHIAFSQVMFDRAAALLARHRSGGPQTDRRAALDALRAAATAQGSSPQDRLLATRFWAGAAQENGDSVEALEASTTAVRLLQEFGWMGLDRDDQERSLRGGAAMPRDAAALAIETGQPELAVELLELGRSVLWHAALQLRGDLAALSAREPGLAAELERIRSAIADGAALDPEARLRLMTRWAGTLAQVRERPDLGDFLAPPRFEALAPAAAGGPVVVVNISSIRCDAIILLPGGRLEVVPLESVTMRETDQVVNTYWRHLGAATGPGATGLTRERARHTAHDTLEWLWQHIASPVLERLRAPDGSGTPARIWWCPTASLTSMPLHAAGRYPRTAADLTEPVGLPFLTVSSYTTTLASLVESRRRPSATVTGLLAVAVTDTGRGHPVLPGAAKEVRALKKVLDREPLTVLLDEAATTTAVRQSLPGHRCAHFACHGGLDAISPSSAGLALRDGDLSVLDIAELRLEGAELAFLSACHTRISGGQLTDEAIHPAGAFRMAGFRHVVATLGTIHDQAAPQVAADLYHQLTTPTGLDPTNTAQALHQAVATLRTTHLTDPTVWAAFVHDGP